MSGLTQRLYREARDNAFFSIIAGLLAIALSSAVVITWQERSAWIIVFFMLAVGACALCVHYARIAGRKFDRAVLGEYHDHLQGL